MSNHVHKHHYILIALFVLLSSGCPFGQEPDEFFFDAFISNESSISFTVYSYFAISSPPIDYVIVEPEEMEVICSYFSPVYVGFGCEIGALKFVFANEKGYYCEKGIGDIIVSPESCFLQGKNPFLPDRLPNNGNGTIFTITQEDFENAYEL